MAESIKRTLVIGNESNLIKPSPRNGEATHSWRCFVCGPNDEEISGWVRQVRFELHNTFETPTRVISKPPYEVIERGWGEFNIQITIFIKGSEIPIHFVHSLKLHSTKTNKKGRLEYPYYSSSYHDFVLTGLNNEAYALVQSFPQSNARPDLHAIIYNEEIESTNIDIPSSSNFEDDELMTSMNNASADVKLKIRQAINIYNQTQKEIAKTKEEIMQLELQEKYQFANSQFVQRSANK